MQLYKNYCYILGYQKKTWKKPQTLNRFKKYTATWKKNHVMMLCNFITKIKFLVNIKIFN